MALKGVQLEICGAVATITLVKPPNVLTLALIQTLSECLDEVSTMDDVTVLVTTGKEGSTTFSGGLHLKELMNNPPTVIRCFQNLLGKYLSLKKTTISAVNGHAIAGGFMLAKAHDYCIAVEGSRMVLNEVSNGLWMPRGMCQFMKSRIPTQFHLRVIALGEEIIVRDEISKTVVDCLTAPSEFLASVKSISSHFAERSLSGLAVAQIRTRIMEIAISALQDPEVGPPEEASWMSPSLLQAKL